MDLGRFRETSSSLKRRMDRHFLPLALAVLALLTLLYFAADAPAAHAQGELDQEFSALAVPPGVVQVVRNGGHKPGRASIGAEYSVALTYDELRDFYDRELARNGWEFTYDEKLTDWGRDYGGYSACYRKRDQRAHLQYAGSTANYGWTYAIDLTWGSSLCR